MEIYPAKCKHQLQIFCCLIYCALITSAIKKLCDTELLLRIPSQISTKNKIIRELFSEIPFLFLTEIFSKIIPQIHPEIPLRAFILNYKVSNRYLQKFSRKFSRISSEFSEQNTQKKYIIQKIL